MSLARSLMGGMAIFLSCSLWAEPLERDYKISGTSYTFKPYQGVYVSKHCEKKCLALKKLTKLKELPQKEAGFMKPKASRICQALNGKTVFGITTGSEDMMAFCVFSDESMIEYRSLESYKLK